MIVSRAQALFLIHVDVEILLCYSLMSAVCGSKLCKRTSGIACGSAGFGGHLRILRSKPGEAPQ